MKRHTKYYIFFVCVISVIFFFINLVNVYGNDTQKSDGGKKESSPSVSVDKDKNTNIETGKKEEKTSTKRETTKKKVPAFWFLLPEK